MMRVSEELPSGDAVLCMPRALFNVTAASSALLKQKQEETRKAMQGLRFLLPHTAPSQALLPTPPAAPPSSISLVPLESRAKTNCIAASSTSPISPTTWTFQVIASLRAKQCSLASDVIAAIDFDETGSRFATGGIARRIRICSYSSLVSDYENLEYFGREGAIEDDDSLEEREFLWPYGAGRSLHYPSSQSGTKRKIRETKGLTIRNHDQAALKIICTPAKLSSLKWRPFGSNVIGCGDYDGVVTEWDVEQGLCLIERYEHSGQKIWSVDYSSWFPTLCASASGDGTVRLWTLNCERSVGIIRSPGRNSICCAEFSSDGPHRVAVACADSNVYIFDVRRLDSSLLCLRGHERAASYARFLGGEELASASIDSTIKLWDVSNVASPGSQLERRGVAGASTAISCLSYDLASESEKTKSNLMGCSNEHWRVKKTFNSHRNVKNFVGLSVWKEGGLIACGSESDEVFVYERSGNEPMWRMKFPSCSSSSSESGLQRLRHSTTAVHEGPAAAHHVNILDSEAQEQEEQQLLEESKRLTGGSHCFVGAVCWQQQHDHLSLLTANSQGTVQIVKVCSNLSD